MGFFYGEVLRGLQMAETRDSMGEVRWKLMGSPLEMLRELKQRFDMVDNVAGRATKWPSGAVLDHAESRPRWAWTVATE